MAEPEGPQRAEALPKRLGQQRDRIAAEMELLERRQRAQVVGQRLQLVVLRDEHAERRRAPEAVGERAQRVGAQIQLDEPAEGANLGRQRREPVALGGEHA